MGCHGRGHTTLTAAGSLRRPALRGALTLAFAGIAITVVAWPFTGRVLTGLDPSWGYALHLARELGLRFGVDIVYTYGPLGFLSVPVPPIGIGSSLAFIASATVYVALMAAAIHGLRRIVPAWAAFGLTLLGAGMITSLPPFEAFQVLVFIAAVEVILGRWSPDPRIVIVGFAIAAAVACLGKSNIGVFTTAMGILVSVTVAPRWWVGPLAFLGAFLAASLTLWLVMGQQLGDLPAFIRWTYEIIAGYSQAMGTDRDPPSRHWIFLAFGVVAAIVAWLTWRASSGEAGMRRLLIAGIVAVLLFAEWKTAFVRGYPGYAFATIAFATTAVLGSAGRSVGMLALASIWIAYLASAPPLTTGPTTYLDPVASTRTAIRTAADALLPWRLDAAAEATGEDLRARYDLPPEVLAAIDGQRLHIEPSEVGVARAYPETRWAPLPVFQTYHAYTAALDELNADRLRGDDRPARILRQFTLASDGRILTVDGRFYWFDAPASTLERLCRYEESVADDEWQVLDATDRACGPEVAMGSVSARTGEPVAVPRADDGSFVIVRVLGLEEHPVGRLRTALLEGQEWYVTLDGDRYRLVPGTVGQGLLLAVPPAAQGSPPFAFGAPIGTISIDAGPDGTDVDTTLTYEFAAVPFPTDPLPFATTPTGAP